MVALLGNTPEGDVLAAVVFALASLTDFIDGYLARSRDSVTTFGKLMDPLADKLLIVAALISLVSLHRLRRVGGDGDHHARARRDRPAPGRHAGRRGDGSQQVRQGQDVPADRADPRADRRPRPPLWVSALLYVTVVVTVLSGLDYFFGMRRRMAAGAHAEAAPQQRLTLAAR